MSLGLFRAILLTSMNEPSPGATAAEPKRPRAEIAPVRAARLVRRFTLPFAVAAGLFFWSRYGVIRVPEGMDTMPSIPAGSACLVDKRGSIVVAGHEVFCDVPDGGTVLSRVVSVTADDAIVLEHDAKESRLPDSRAFGPLPRSAVRGVVLVVFVADTAPADVEVPRGR